jgi:hypothetical protein
VIGWDIGRIEHGRDNNINGVPFEILRREIIAHYSGRGNISGMWITLLPRDSMMEKTKNRGNPSCRSAQHQKFLDCTIKPPIL